MPDPGARLAPEGDKQVHGSSPLAKQSVVFEGAHLVTGGGKERLAPACTLHGENFKTDPAITYLLHDWDRDARLNYVPEYIGSLLTAASLNDAIFDEAWQSTPPNDATTPPQCSAVWLPPGKKIDSMRTYTSAGMYRMLLKVGISGIKRALGDFQSCANRAKKKGLARKDGSGQLVPFYYLFFISTAVEARGQQLASKVIRRFQNAVLQEGKGLPLWLEATTEKSMRLYARLGFEHVDSWVLGKGVVDNDGEPSKGGEGVRIWAMVWWPNSDKSEPADANGI